MSVTSATATALFPYFLYTDPGCSVLSLTASVRLRRAIHLNDASLARRILRNNPHLLHNPDPESSDSNLHLAARLGFLPVCEVLVAAGHEHPSPALNADNQTALMLAAAAGHTDVVHFLANYSPSSILRRDCEGRDAVMQASIGGHDTVLQILLTYAPGGPASAVQNVDCDGNTALHFASSNGNLPVMRTLLAAGADPRKTNMECWTALEYSATLQTQRYLSGLVTDVEKKKKSARRDGEGSKGMSLRFMGGS
ncbi:hypothetical protein TD95_002946 [Thielaviopsis punctulata]|uniref:Uncharacterized protein n=1 Tax=Thielaviopsis punctulata TaxID=72032 RepID=A0A0F4ZKC9_9PEZI|nr:hypothetical protein TD95_002946 [Thielaviopsis punctulata]